MVATLSRYDVNMNALDEEWVAHPKKYHRAARKLADAKLELASAKSMLEIVEAELFLDIKQNPEKYDLSKSPSDGMAKIIVLVQKRYRKADRRVNQKKHEVDVLEADVNGYEHKKRALENLVTLHGQDYFSRPRVPRHANAETKEVYNNLRKKKLRTMGRKVQRGNA